jgi:hypothetical protein
VAETVLCASIAAKIGSALTALAFAGAANGLAEAAAADVGAVVASARPAPPAATPAACERKRRRVGATGAIVL